MRTSAFQSTILSTLIVAMVSSLGCVPIPVSPYISDRKEDQFWVHERYERVPILGPVTSGGMPRALDPPSEDEVMRALESCEGGVPFLWEKSRDNVRVVVEPIADYVDPPRVYPLIGPAQHHHCHYRCTIYYSETVRRWWPVPETTIDEDSVQVVFIDHNHLHIVGSCDVGGNY